MIYLKFTEQTPPVPQSESWQQTLLHTQIVPEILHPYVDKHISAIRVMHWTGNIVIFGWHF
jgi:hypothetical protein